MNKLITTIAIIVAVIFFALAINHGIKLHEKNECLRWREEAGIYPNYYLTDWQVKQCEHYGL